MDACSIYLYDLALKLPDLCSPRHLVKMGLGTDTTMQRWRMEGKGPPYFKINGRYYYPKRGILQFLEQSKCSK